MDGDELVKDITEKGILKPCDAKKYFNYEEEKKLEEILKSPDMDEAEKLILIYSTFDNDKGKRDYWVKHLNASSRDLYESNPIGNEEGIIFNHNKNKQMKKTVTDPYERWRLFTLLDPNYTKEYIDGYLIVNLTNVQKTIVEKMYQKIAGKNCPAYGTATFILDTENYEKISGDLKKDDKFNIPLIRQKLKEEPEKIMKITHHSYGNDEQPKSTWGKRLIKSICKKEEEVYSSKELEEISKCIKEIENSRKEIER